MKDEIVRLPGAFWVLPLNLRNDRHKNCNQFFRLV